MCKCADSTLTRRPDFKKNATYLDLKQKNYIVMTDFKMYFDQSSWDNYQKVSKINRFKCAFTPPPSTHTFLLLPK